MVVKKAVCYTSKDIHRALFAKTPKRRSLKEMKEGIRRHIETHWARRSQ